MYKEKQKTLSQMQIGQSGVVVQIQGGHGIVDRLNSLGIRVGKRITKISSMIMRGPVTIQVDRSQIAIGFGMASKITVEIDQIIK
ncbi:MAG: FeoA family protein [Dehalococcoidales bacterium]|nr:FeoA family protein [Dehalococcoidales bacterium]